MFEILSLIFNSKLYTVEFEVENIYTTKVKPAASKCTHINSHLEVHPVSATSRCTLDSHE